MIELLRSPWASRFDEVIAAAKNSLLLCTPYIGRSACNRVTDRLGLLKSQTAKVLIVTDLSLQNMFSGATDPSAIADLVRNASKTTVKFLPSVHAKVYIADLERAVVTSANMTDSGLFRNFEYGVLFSDSQTVKAIHDDVIEYSELGTCIDELQLRAFATAIGELREMHVAAERQVRTRIRREFEQRLRKTDEDLLRARTAGRTPHAIFADAILFLLRRGPMKTIDLHKAIRQIHPDLCDDTIDRVIDGRHFGKKWKHGVRTAQVFLRRRGDIQLTNKQWELVKTEASK
jgi:phosphatidylserine/phosphatidylglycerophosphate/cardiolipin synthase-like enzyme